MWGNKNRRKKIIGVIIMSLPDCVPFEQMWKELNGDYDEEEQEEEEE